LRAWSEGGAPADLPRISSGTAPARDERDVFAFFISGGKVRAPSGAMALIKRLEA
jgi:hypothetical protein